jgi:hypothetical protein
MPNDDAFAADYALFVQGLEPARPFPEVAANHVAEGSVGYFRESAS